MQLLYMVPCIWTALYMRINLFLSTNPVPWGYFQILCTGMGETELGPAKAL